MNKEKPYVPSEEEIKKAEDMMTPKQKELSEFREKLLAYEAKEHEQSKELLQRLETTGIEGDKIMTSANVRGTYTWIDNPYIKDPAKLKKALGVEEGTLEQKFIDHSAFLINSQYGHHEYQTIVVDTRGNKDEFDNDEAWISNSKELIQIMKNVEAKINEVLHNFIPKPQE